jgi:hypothetical protein
MKALLFAALLTVAGAVQAADLTGTWNMTLETPNGTGTPTVDFKQEGAKLTGTYKGRFGESKLEGTVNDQAVKFQVKLNMQGQEFAISFDGSLQSDGTLKGKADFAGQAEGSWTAKRAGGAAAAKASGAVDVTGKWVFNVETSAGSGSPNFEFKQEGETLTGNYSGQLGTAKLEGTVKERKIEFKFTVDVGGNSGTVVYSGTVQEDGTMKGKVDLAGMGEGTFTGKRAN